MSCEKIVVELGAKFSSFEEIKSFMTRYEDQEKQLFVIGKNAKKFVHQFPKEISPNEDLIYYILPYKCKFNQERAFESEQLRQTRYAFYLIECNFD